MDCSPLGPGSSVHAILQVQILEKVAISFSRGSAQPTDQTQVSYVSCIGGWVLYHWATGEAPRGKKKKKRERENKITPIKIYISTGLYIGLYIQAFSLAMFGKYHWLKKKNM